MGLIVEIRVTPSSGRSTLCLDASGKLKAFLKSPPEDGKANRELVQLLARGLKCSQSLITIISGATYRTKKVRIELPLSYDEVISKLGFAVQTNIIG